MVGGFGKFRVREIDSMTTTRYPGNPKIYHSLYASHTLKL